MDVIRFCAAKYTLAGIYRAPFLLFLLPLLVCMPKPTVYAVFQPFFLFFPLIPALYSADGSALMLFIQYIYTRGFTASRKSHLTCNVLPDGVLSSSSNIVQLNKGKNNHIAT